MEKQLNFLNIKQEKNLEENIFWQAYIDGASRNNPGPAGAGVYIKKNDEIFLKKGFFLGEKTNNQAEYLALALALFFIKQDSSKKFNISIISDSELLIKQMNGIYQVKSPELIKIRNFIIYLLKNTKTTFKHVLRENNKIADKLANEGIDKKQKLPQDFLILAKNFDIE